MLCGGLGARTPPDLAAGFYTTSCHVGARKRWMTCKNEGEKDFMGRNLESNTTACGIKVERIAIAAARNANKAVTHCFKRDGPCITVTRF
jgi:hypothetical protein